MLMDRSQVVVSVEMGKMSLVSDREGVSLFSLCNILDLRPRIEAKPAIVTLAEQLSDREHGCSRTRALDTMHDEDDPSLKFGFV